MIWLLLITLVSLKAGVPDQHQDITYLSEAECEKAKVKFLKDFPRIMNPNWDPQAECVSKPAGLRAQPPPPPSKGKP